MASAFSSLSPPTPSHLSFINWGQSVFNLSCPSTTSRLPVKSESESLRHLVMPNCDLMDYSPPDSSVHRILQARILEWVAISRDSNLNKTSPQISYHLRLSAPLFLSWHGYFFLNISGFHSTFTPFYGNSFVDGHQWHLGWQRLLSFSFVLISLEHMKLWPTFP